VLNSSGGGVFIVAGGAPLYLSSYDAVPSAKNGGVAVDQWDINNPANPAAHLNAVPANGTVLNSSGGGVFIVAGGAPLYLSSYDAVPSAKNGGVAVDQWDINNPANPAAHLNAVPSNGTFINTATGHVYRIAGGAPFAVSSWSVFGGVQPYVTVDQWDLDNIANPGAHLKARPVDGTLVEGLPAHAYWSFNGGLRSPAAAGSGAVSVDDVGLAAFPQPACPSGQTGTPPNCKTPTPTTCPSGQTGTPPNCKTPTPATCPSGQTATPPNCKMPTPAICPAGQTGTPPNCQSAQPAASQLRCVIPNLKHMTLAQAQGALRAGHCGVGRVSRPRHVARRRTLRVNSQSAPTGAQHSANYPVNVTLR
jgi:hypothetical protein